MKAGERVRIGSMRDNGIIYLLLPSHCLHGLLSHSSRGLATRVLRRGRFLLEARPCTSIQETFVIEINEPFYRLGNSRELALEQGADKMVRICYVSMKFWIRGLGT